MAITKRMFRMISGISIIMASSWMSWFISKTVGFDSIGTVAITTILGFIGGIIFWSGGKK